MRVKSVRKSGAAQVQGAHAVQGSAQGRDAKDDTMGVSDSDAFLRCGSREDASMVFDDEPGRQEWQVLSNQGQCVGVRGGCLAPPARNVYCWYSWEVLHDGESRARTGPCQLIVATA